MPIVPDGGCNETEDPTLLPPNILTKATGAEYRVGKQGVFVARGRETRGTVSATGRSIYQASFDAVRDYIVTHHGDTYQTGEVAAGISFLSGVSCGNNTMFMIGTHYADRHYLVNGSSNMVLESTGTGVTFRTMGMAKPSNLTLGTSVTQGSGSFTVSTGLQYWITEYDNNRGIESIYGVTSSSTGAFSSKDSVVVSIGGVSSNSNATHYRIYRTVDGGTFPDGGLIDTIAISNTSYTDTLTSVSTLTTPSYGTVNIGGLDFDRDVQPDTLATIGSFEDSLVGFMVGNRRGLRFTAAGFPESWPTVFEVPLEPTRHDIGMAHHELSGQLGVFSQDTVYRVSRLPREVDSAFAAGEVRVTVTDERGCVSRRGVCAFTIPGRAPLLAFVARDGIFATDLSTVFPLTDGVLWKTRVDATALENSVLRNDALDRRMVFLYRKVGSSSNDGVMYLDYQRDIVRVTHPDHGELADMTDVPYQGLRQMFSIDARTGNGTVYTEANQDEDDSMVLDSSGSVAFNIKTSEIFPSGNIHDSVHVGDARIMHDATSATVYHALGIDRQPHGNLKLIDFSERKASKIGLSRDVNSLSLEITSSGTQSYGVHFFDIEPQEESPLGGRGGA